VERARSAELRGGWRILERRGGPVEAHSRSSTPSTDRGCNEDRASRRPKDAVHAVGSTLLTLDRRLPVAYSLQLSQHTLRPDSLGTPLALPVDPNKLPVDRIRAAGSRRRGAGSGPQQPRVEDPDPVTCCLPPEPRIRAPDACGSQPPAPALTPAPGTLYGCGHRPGCASVVQPSRLTIRVPSATLSGGWAITTSPSASPSTTSAWSSLRWPTVIVRRWARPPSTTNTAQLS
jgi:hypothetical protein